MGLVLYIVVHCPCVIPEAVDVGLHLQYGRKRGGRAGAERVVDVVQLHKVQEEREHLGDLAWSGGALRPIRNEPGTVGLSTNLWLH